MLVPSPGKGCKMMLGGVSCSSRSLRSTNRGVEVDFPALKPNCTGEIRSSIACFSRWRRRHAYMWKTVFKGYRSVTRW